MNRQTLLIILLIIVAGLSYFFVPKEPDFSGGESVSIVPPSVEIEKEEVVEEKVEKEITQKIPQTEVVFIQEEPEPPKAIDTTALDEQEEIENLSEQLKEIQEVVEDLQKGIETIEVEEVQEEVVPNPAYTVSTPTAFEQEVARIIHEKTNEHRQAAGLGQLSLDSVLEDLARIHSDDMAERDYFSHDTPEGCNITCRITDVGYSAYLWGENIAWQQSTPFPGADVIADRIMTGWMNSPGHRANILRTGFTHEGIGVVRIDDQVYATVNFSKPKE